MNVYIKMWYRAFLVAVTASLLSNMVMAQETPPVKHIKKTNHAVTKASGKHLPLHKTQSQAAAGAAPLDPERAQAFSEYASISSQSLDLANQGNDEANQGNWKAAGDYYQQALDLWPDDSVALYGLGQCAAAAGDIDHAINFYRRVVYTNDPSRYGTVPGDRYNTNDVTRLMEFVLLLSKGGHKEEALTVYRRAAGLLNYQDGKQNLDVLLPDFGPNGWAYTPQRMEAMAHIAIAYEKEGFDKKAVALHFQQALLLAPDSPLPYYYNGKRLVGVPGRNREVLVNLRTAAHLGDDEIKAVVEKRLKDWNVESDAQAEQDQEDQQKKQAIAR